MVPENKDTCLCPVCRTHVIPKRCTSFRSTCRPQPGCNCRLTGIQAQLIADPDIYLAHGENVPFNTVISSRGDAVRHNSGIFVLGKSGTYLVNWNVAAEGCGSAPFVRFALLTDGEIHSAAAIPVTVGMLSGSAFVIAAENISLALVNDTNDRVRLQNVRPMANITIVYVG